MVLCMWSPPMKHSNKLWLFSARKWNAS
jgi:hypothetical protein